MSHLIIAARCDRIPEPAHSVLSASDTNADGHQRVSYGETVAYYCQDGYAIDGGDTRRTCQPDGTINGTDIICTGRLVLHV